MATTASTAFSTLRVGFAGTPAFAATALSALLAAGHTITRVLTQPDRPKGRGLAMQESAVKALARVHALPLSQPPTLRTPEAQAALLAEPLDVLVVAAYGLILPPEILAWPRHGCINIHASLLPRWRGAAPIVRAVEAGDAHTGVCIMQMDAGLDTGGVIVESAVAIAPGDTAGTLHDTLAQMGAQAIVQVLAHLRAGETVSAVPQSATGVTYARKVERAEARVDWTQPAATIARSIRAFNPVPAAWTTLAGEPLKLWRAQPIDVVPSQGPPGSVLAASGEGILVACGQGALAITELQSAGAKRMDAAAFCAGRPPAPGIVLGA